MNDQTVIRFDAGGDAQSGLQTWDPVPAEFVASGSPTQKGHMFFATDNDAFTCGVWDSTPYEEVKGPYAVDEFMILLEGSLDIEQADGSILAIKAGDAFVIPRGAVVAWKQSEYLRKYFFIYDNPRADPAPAGLAAMRVDPGADLPVVGEQDPSMYIGDLPEMGWLTLYRDRGAKFQVGVWDCSPMQRIATTIERSEFMHILEGSGSITNADGVVFEFSAGDSFLVPVGMGYQWRNDSYVRKIFCSYTA